MNQNTPKKAKAKVYTVLSPDGIPIERHGVYRSIKKAREAATAWMKRFEAQGYYSANYGRVSLEDLPYELELVTL